MKDVARAAGVSTATVSRVLSRSGYASAATRARVLEVTDRLGYRLDARAQGLRKRQSTTLGILVPDLSNPVNLSFIRGVQHVAQQCGYVVVVADAQHAAAVERRQLELFQSQRVAAVIVAGIMQDQAALSIFEPGGSLIIRSPDPSLASLSGEAKAIDDAVADLARRGHRAVLFAARSPSRDDDPPTRLTEIRRRSVRTSAARLGLGVEECALPTTLSAGEAARRLGAMLAAPDGTRAVICASHLLAPPILGALAGLGWDIPGQISFITFGDSEWAAAYRPALSVIYVDRYREARRITRDLLEELGETPDPEEAPAQPAYVARGSVGDRPEAGGQP
jgi:DNA-binding LacI/PurR family transcriptional regulator